MSKAMLMTQLEFSRHLIVGSASEMTDEEALEAPPGGGNGFNWILGHILVSRARILALLGDETGVIPAEKAGAYSRGSDGRLDSSSAMSLAAMLDALDSSQWRLVGALDRLGDEALAQLVPESPFGRDEETLGTLLAGFLFHEAYHAGQLGLLLRLAGHEGVIR
jgi:uncharacterized damage-inducible protein DinB